MVSGGLKFAAAECLNRAAASLRPFTSTSTRNAAVVQVRIEGGIRLAKSFKLFVFRAILTKNWRFRCFVVAVQIMRESAFNVTFETEKSEKNSDTFTNSDRKDKQQNSKK